MCAAGAPAWRQGAGAVEATLALLKPDLLADARRVQAVEWEIRERHGLAVAGRAELMWTRAQATAFYAEHHGRPFQGRLVGYMASGPLIALALAGPRAIARWRAAMGATRPAVERANATASLRARFGLTDTRNSFHGSDSPDTARRELDFTYE
ncbi:hypothetical protein H4R18_001974 [Coemansia javaensis]|uniref:Nucleoside diphosphate kinase n=1 Tax=Coemansia javaensis TaxID=2761396 RepID=A0A9W8LKQ9_9FUNG|nr:hypothetical protein H4R18_001974 [Coemansia javaensis]